jgi:hypothetical protein
MVLGERDRVEYLNVAAGLAVLAGIAASDAICCVRLGLMHRGPDHRGAIEILGCAVPDGKALASCLARLLDVKDAAHYGVVFFAPPKAGNAMKWARRLLDRAGEEIER